MTRDEVMAMTVEELRIKAAELTGWEKVKFAPEYGDLWGNRPENDEGHGEGWDVIPDYPHDIAAAWGLVEELKGRERQVELLERPADSHARIWMTVDDGPDYIPGLTAYDPIGMTADTMSRAITRAFILAMTQEDNG